MGGGSVYEGGDDDDSVGQNLGNCSITLTLNRMVSSISMKSRLMVCLQLCMDTILADVMRYRSSGDRKAQSSEHTHRCSKSFPHSFINSNILLIGSPWQSLLACTTKRLLKIKGFSDIKVEKIKNAAKLLSVSHHACFYFTASLMPLSPLPVVSSLPQS